MEEPLDALVHAVCSVRPRPYYFVDSPAMSIMREVGTHVNIEVTDAAIAGAKHLAGLKRKFSASK